MAYLKIVNVSKNYKDGENVYLALKNINLEFNKNEFVAILGESGSGKSTLLNLIIGISEITKGNIYLNNQSLKNFSTKEMNKYRKNELGIIFQKYNLIDLYNIYENLDLVRKKDVDKGKIKHLLNKVGLSKKINDKVSQTSGGEAQRIACVRALINNPSLIICDEPTGALDQENSEILMNYLMSIKENRLILFVTHNKELANKYASRIIELKDGKVIKDTLVKEKESKETYSSSLDYPMKFKHKLFFSLNLINKKKGRFLISLLSSVFLLFFISISLMVVNVTNKYINYSFLSSLDANVLNLKSYSLDNKELKEVEIPSLILNELEKDDNYIIRKNYNHYLNNNLLPNLEFKTNNQKINLMGIELCCMSLHAQIDLKMGENITNFNEVIINENLYNYLVNEKESIINKRFNVLNNEDLDYFKIKGVSKSSLMNDSLVIYFNYEFIKEYYLDKEIKDYQIDIKDLNKLDEVITKLKNSLFYKEIEEINDNSLNYSFEYSLDLENYYTFYELINLAKIVVYFFLGLTLIISVMLLSNVLYSFNEEEKRNLALLKVLGFSYYDLSFISLLIGMIISLVSFLIIIIVNYYLNLYISPYLRKFLDLNIELKLSNFEYLIIYFIILFFSLVSCIFPLIKLRFMKLDDALKEE